MLIINIQTAQQESLFVLPHHVICFKCHVVSEQTPAMTCQALVDFHCRGCQYT